MSVIKKSTFLGGALAITAAGVINSVMGALYRPIMVRLFAVHDGLNGNLGIGLFQIPLAYYQLVLAFSAFGFNTAIARLIAEREGRADWGGVRAVLRVGTLLTASVGGLLAVVMFFGADLLAKMSANPSSVYGFKAVAPAVFVVTVSAALRGLFQGVQVMHAVAWSQIIEVIVRFLACVAAVAYFAPRSVVTAAAVANGSALVGATVALGYLVWVARRSLLAQPETHSGYEEKPTTIFRKLILTAVPIALIGSLQPVTYLIDTVVSIRQLVATGLNLTTATAQYGQLFQAYSIINLPPVVGQALYLSLIPTMTSAMVRKDFKEAGIRLNAALRYVILLGIPSWIGIWALATPIYGVMFGSSTGARLLAVLSCSIPFLMIQSVSTAVLQAVGDFLTPIVALVVAMGVKVASTYGFTHWIGVDGTAWSTVAAFATIACISLWAAGQRIRLSPVLLSYLARAVLGSLIMYLVIWFVGQRLLGWESVTLIVRVLLGAAGYFGALVCMGGITWNELSQIARLRKKAL